jgi:hypothetical protein
MSMPVLPIRGKPHTAKLTLLARLVLGGTESARRRLYGKATVVVQAISVSEAIKSAQQLNGFGSHSFVLIMGELARQIPWNGSGLDRGYLTQIPYGVVAIGSIMAGCHPVENGPGHFPPE